MIDFAIARKNARRTNLSAAICMASSCISHLRECDCCSVS
jgi:hypothetical protein